MTGSSSFFRTIPIDSPIHRMAAETKVVAGVLISIGLVFNTEWSNIGVAALLLLIAFRASKLPLSVLPRVPLLVQFALFGGLLGSIFSNEEPRLGAFSLGGLSDYARLIGIGFIMILWVGILSWTTGLTAVGFAIRRLIRPLRFLGIPVDEIGSVIALAVRSLPLVADEIDVVNESVTSRPSPADLANKPFREAFSFIRDTSTAVVIGSHRRARDLSMAMVSRASTTAPLPPRADFSRLDIAVMIGAAALAVTAFLVPGFPPNSEAPLPEVRGVVFEDLDLDGERADADSDDDDFEAGVQGVTVRLVARVAGTADQVVDTFETTERGSYAFVAIEPGTYIVEFEAPDGRRFTSPSGGRTDELLLEADEIRADELDDVFAGLAPAAN
ncbi:MAG: CbiQ family ECF transporter T component [Actinomycetota bacterium]